MDSLDRPTLSKTRTNSSSLVGRRPSRTTSSKYGSIIEEERNNNSSNSNKSDSDYEDSQEQPLEGENVVFGIQPVVEDSDRLSMNSLDYELTLKDKQEVCTAKIKALIFTNFAY